jgi:hypothetical protein
MVEYDLNSRIGNYHGSDAWRNATYFRFGVEDSLILKNLKSEKLESVYIDTILCWKKEDNEMPTEHIATLIHFMSKLVDFTPEFIKKYDVKQYHINLIRRMYIEHEGDGDGKMALMDYKRPYGNSHVLGDVYEEYEKVCGYPIKFEDIPKDYLEGYVEGESDPTDFISDYISEYWFDNNGDFLLNIHNETMDILEHMIKELEITSFEWFSDNSTNNFNWNSQWTPTPKGIQQYKSLKRKDKLIRILKD